jgi:hypothetical protein
MADLLSCRNAFRNPERDLMMTIQHTLTRLSVCLLLSACGEASSSDGACALTVNTTASATSNPSGCTVLSRDTTSCQAARKAMGLSGVWLQYSCRVTLTSNGGGSVTATADGQPDYKSFYFAANNACYEAWPQGFRNPNTLAAQSYSVSFPGTPNTSATSRAGTAVVGLAVNGVPIFGNFAAPGDDIYRESMTFDKCGAHPENTGKYHYHSEPAAITYDDSHLVGMMRDGYPIYGRRDMDGSMPTLDVYGGHTAITADSSGAAIYHYHVNKQISTTPGTAGQSQWFLTTGSWRGTPAPCTTCR